MKLAFISHTLPPVWSGQAMVIHKLLEQVDPASYCLISQHTSEARIEQNNYSAKLPCPYYHLPLDWQIPRGARFGVRALNIPLGVWLDLAARGISGPVVVHPHQAAAKIPAIQRQAEMLFLPLAFDSPYPEIIKTSAPGKLGEYLAASRPILAHAPPDSFVALFLREHECGLVVSESDPAKLASAIQQIASDVNLRRILCSNALAQARDKFDATISQAQSPNCCGSSYVHEESLVLPRQQLNRRRRVGMAALAMILLVALLLLPSGFNEERASHRLT